MWATRRIAWCSAFGVYVLWSLATYLLEGKPGTLNRPADPGLRLTYTLVANIGLGLILPLWVVRGFVRRGWGRSEDFGFTRPRVTAAGIPAAAATGYALFAIASPEPLRPLVLASTFAQVWTVTVAEVAVCWALAGGIVLVTLRAWNRATAHVASACVASVLFGL